MRAILRQDIGWHDSAEDGSLTTRLALDTQLIQDGMGNFPLLSPLFFMNSHLHASTGEKLGMFFRSISSFLTAVVIAYVYGWKLALVMYVYSSVPFHIKSFL